MHIRYYLAGLCLLFLLRAWSQQANVNLEVNVSSTSIPRPAITATKSKQKVTHEYYVGGRDAHEWATWRHLLYFRFLPNLWRKN